MVDNFLICPYLVSAQTSFYPWSICFFIYLSLYTISFTSDFYKNTLVSYILKAKQKHFLDPIFLFLK